MQACSWGQQSVVEGLHLVGAIAGDGLALAYAIGWPERAAGGEIGGIRDHVCEILKSGTAEPRHRLVEMRVRVVRERAFAPDHGNPPPVDVDIDLGPARGPWGDDPRGGGRGR